jgi:hypothetical protein
MNFVTGIIVGVVLATIGVSSVARYIDQGVDQVQAIVRSVTQ